MKKPFAYPTSDPFRPLPRKTAAELRGLYWRAPTAEARALLWEIHRLRRLLLGIRNGLLQKDAAPMQERVQWAIDELGREPCVAEAAPIDRKKQYQEAIATNAGHWAHDRLAEESAIQVQRRENRNRC